MKRLIIALVAFLSIQLVTANPSDPVGMLEKVTSDIIVKLKSNQDQYLADHEKLVHMVQTELTPYVASNEIARNVLGPRYWQKATKQQQEEFKALFIKMVVQVYAGAFASYADQKVRYFPVRNLQDNQKVVNVRSVVHSKLSQQNIMISYQMIRLDSGWKVLDFSVDGVSLTNNYRSQFSNALANDGLPTLLKQMHANVEGRR